MEKPKYKRILLKLSGEVLRNKKSGHSLDAEKINGITQQIKSAKEFGTEIGIVIGGGNIYRGYSGEAFGIKRTPGDHIGMLATVINSLALQSGLENIGIDTRVMTALPMPSIAEPFILRKAIRHLEKKRVVIFGAGIGNPYFTTDSAAALRASEIEADLLFKGTKVDGVYDADPMKNPGAKKIPKLTYTEAIKKRLRIMDTAAFSLCMDNQIPIVVFDFFIQGNFMRALCGEGIGSLIHGETNLEMSKVNKDMPLPENYNQEYNHARF